MTVLDVIVSSSDALGECVVWCDRSQRVLWTDILGRTLHVHHPASGSTQHWPMPERLASFALTEEGNRLLLGLASRLAFFDLGTSVLTPIADVPGQAGTRLNDGRCDRQGNFVFGTMHEGDPKQHAGAFYRLNATGLALERLEIRAVAIANSICFSPDGATLYYCDSPERAIRCCDYPSLANDRVFAHVQGGGEPDGSCIDAEGYLWNAQWGAGRVTRYAPDGSVSLILPAVAQQPTCTAFGGPGLDFLFCTSARVGLDSATAHDGALLGTRLDAIRGLPECRFTG